MLIAVQYMHREQYRYNGLEHHMKLIQPRVSVTVRASSIRHKINDNHNSVIIMNQVGMNMADKS